MEELKKGSPELLSKLADMRTRGIAEIPKIERRKTNARVRNITTSNSRSGAPVSTYAYGTEVFRELIPGMEDIRRYDAFYVVDQNDVSADVGDSIRQDAPDEYTGQYDPDASRNLVLWGWTRKAEQVVFEDWTHLLNTAKELCDKYTDIIPIMDKGSARLKLARLSAALAVRTFSHADNDIETVSVRRCHVEAVQMFLNRIYCAKSFGYDRLTAAVREQSTVRNPLTVIDKIIALNYPMDFIECALRTQEIDVRDIRDWCDWDSAEATEFIGFLVRQYALKRDGRCYKKTSSFIEILRKLLDDDAIKTKAKLPNFVKDTL